jgi:hypothetical protein
MTVVELKTRPNQVIASVVERLEEVLKDAKEGKITAVAVAAIETGGAVLTSWSETDDFAALLGAVSRLLYRLNVNQPATDAKD